MFANATEPQVTEITQLNFRSASKGRLDPANGSAIGLAIETGGRFHRELTFPEIVDAGLRVARIGASSVCYEVGLFGEDHVDAAATGFFVHVFVDRRTRQPAPILEPLRAALEKLHVGSGLD